MTFDPARTAVVGLHWQHDVVSADGAFGSQFAAEAERTEVVPATAKLVAGARSAGVFVVHMRIAFQPGYADMVPNAPLYQATRQRNALVEGTPGAEIVADLAPLAGDLVLTNNRAGGFSNSSLDFVLRARGVDTLLITGVATNITVESTARQASDLGYRAVVLGDCSSADSWAGHQASLSVLNVLADVSTSTEAIAAFSR